MNECMKLYWEASDLDEAEAITRLVAITKKERLPKRTSKNRENEEDAGGPIPKV